MAVYNEPIEYITAAVESVLNQSFNDFEFIIVLDNPVNLIAKECLVQYANKDNRIKILINDENIGLALSLNKALKVSTSNYIARMDADDISYPNRFEEEYNYLEKHKDIDVVSCNKIYIDEQGTCIGKGRSLNLSVEQIGKILKFSNIILHSGVMMRRYSVLSVNGYRNFPTTQDRDLWCRMISKGKKIAILDKYLLEYRINKNSISENKALKQALISFYIEKLHRLQLSYQTDDFSPENLSNFLRLHKVEDEKELCKYKEARSYYNSARIAISNKKYLAGVWKIIEAFFSHYLLRHRIYNEIKVYLIKTHKM